MFLCSYVETNARSLPQRLSEAPTTSPDSVGQMDEETGFLRALCNAAGGDGTASKKERDHIVGMASVKGYIPEVIEKVDEMADAAEKKTIEEMATDAKMSMSIGTLRFAAGAIVFEAIKAASKVRENWCMYNGSHCFILSQSLA